MNKRNFVRVGCVFMAFATLTSLSGCSGKATPANFRKLETALSAEIYEADDKEELEELFDDDDMKDQLEDGIIIILSDDCIANLYDEALDDAGRDAGLFSELYYGDNFVPEEDIVSMQMYIQAVDDEGDYQLVYTTMIEFKDKKTADFIFSDYIDNLDGVGWLCKFIGNGFNVSDLNSSEYSYRSGNSGHLIYNYDYERLTDIIDANEDAYELMDIDPDDILDEYEDEIEDAECFYGSYFSGNTITVVAAFSSTGEGLENVTTICNTLGLKDPAKVENSDTLTQLFSAITLPYASSAGRYLARARQAAAEYPDPEYTIDYDEEDDEDYFEF